jgi:hypothetical protein
VSGEAFQRFEVWFGIIFLGIGLLALLIASVLCFAAARSPRYWPLRWAFLSAPLGIGVIFSVMGGGTAAYGLWQFDIEQRILVSGTLTRATVTGIEQTYTRVNGRYLWRVRYQYTDAGGQPHVGASGRLSADEARTWQPGEPVFVRYDPAEPGMSVWLGREARAAMISPTHLDSLNTVRSLAGIRLG